MPELQTRKTEPMKTGRMYRYFTVTREAVNVEMRTVPISFSSETPCDRWFGTEILDHSPSSVRLGRLTDGGAVLLEQIGRAHV